LPIARGRLYLTHEDADVAALDIDNGKAVKGIAKGIIQKTEIGAVEVGFVDHSQLKIAFASVQDSLASVGAEPVGILIEEMLQDSIEVIVSVTRDRQFGLVLAYGAGGTLADLIDDVGIRVLPIEAADIDAMLSAVRIDSALLAPRHGPAYDLPTLASLLWQVARLAIAIGDELEYLELNPIMVGRESGGAVIVDAVMAPRAGAGASSP
jgi:hypothetical protein